ncbi:glycosyltransferase family 4 protein [Mesorhizobium sp. ESP-6-4]|nr:MULTISPECIES: glycosyltransferase family 4 protein [unclassified Mesorhizobium]MBZ9658672.1 glycosyltransferase family 4 protein [Mesorhizobium sp. ESP-6-4]MBZ9734869.1 glycosyltransferase family 4 protein [Mesorhizobium sp. CA9]MBZ9816796.1 glycosyltransferase family 4 protein [Mesorhizobium sp. CA7]MBZ9827168.1 glycosyltransferase family 4 protein [Mesorhizobium sp. CA18]MBZ9832612.1 glycosyltransferase family 4 protein [Mesorhizobium sp. CA2]
MTILTTRQVGHVESSATIKIQPARVLSNPGTEYALGRSVLTARRDFDCVVGFNKMAGLDIYYAGDPPYFVSKLGWWRPFSPRFMRQQNLESMIFAPGNTVQIIALSENQAALYRDFWRTEESRIHVVGPTLDPKRRRPELLTVDRNEIRDRFGLPRKSVIALTIANRLKVKGLDRAVKGLQPFPDIHWLIAGLRKGSEEETRLRALIAKSGMSERVTLLGIQEDIPAIVVASDFMLHPARLENTGTVILEALANGLPVIASDACGYAKYVEASGAGLVVANRDDPEIWRQAILKAGNPAVPAQWHKAALAYGASNPLTGGLEAACDLIETSRRTRRVA